MTDTTNALRALVEAAEAALSLAREAVPGVAHYGSCGPESQCDASCMDAYYSGQIVFRLETALVESRAALATAQPEAKPEGVNYAVLLNDLAMLVRKLARDLTKAKPDADLPAKALDYLNRKGLHARILRGAADHSSTHHVHRGAESLPCYCPATMDHGIGEEATRQAQGGGEDAVAFLDRIAHELESRTDLRDYGMAKALAASLSGHAIILRKARNGGLQ